MIRSLAFIAALGLGASAFAAESDAPRAASVEPPIEAEPPKDDVVARNRTPFEVLSERMLGTASRAVRFDWRRETMGFGVTGSQIVELNNFNSARFGGFVRTPVSVFMLELAFTHVWTWGSAATQDLSLTPYRQAARPSRYEIDINLALPLIEGVGTPRFRFFPNTELVFSFLLGLRYRIYPGSLSGVSTGDAVLDVLKPQLGTTEVANLESQRLPGMQIDPSRYSILSGFTLDFYFQNGLFFEPRIMVGPDLSSNITFWWEMSASLGWGF